MAAKRVTVPDRRGPVAMGGPDRGIIIRHRLHGRIGQAVMRRFAGCYADVVGSTAKQSRARARALRHLGTSHPLEQDQSPELGPQPPSDSGDLVGDEHA